jgi:hypothetical protein
MIPIKDAILLVYEHGHFIEPDVVDAEGAFHVQMFDKTNEPGWAFAVAACWTCELTVGIWMDVDQDRVPCPRCRRKTLRFMGHGSRMNRCYCGQRWISDDQPQRCTCGMHPQWRHHLHC